MDKRSLFLIFGITVWIILSFSFKNNIFDTASRYFDYFQYDSESLVVGRLILSERDGLAAHAGFLGKVYPVPSSTDPFWYQYEAYRNQYEFDTYEAYYSQPGVQAFLYGLFCKITGLSGDDALEFFYWNISLFNGLIFTLFLLWVFYRWKLATAIFTFVTILFSQWIIYFGHNIFWVLGIFYLPFVVSLWYLQFWEEKVKRTGLLTFVLMFVCVFTKCLLTGFEYITTTLVMSVTPWFFYGFIYKWNLRTFLKRFTAVSAGALSAVLLTIFWLAIQLSFVKGTLSEGFDYIFYSLNRRTYVGGNTDMDSFYMESLKSNLWDVLATYWNGHAYDLAHWFEDDALRILSKGTFGSSILFFFFVSILVLVSKSIKYFPRFRRQQIALTITLWLSLLAPLSWFVIFKGHSYVHPHMNHIIWHMPFMLLGAVLTGSMFCFYIRTWNFRKKIK
ncbi:hypothetical protein [Parabacteroides sp. AM08-6]|uniref:hypothetical protein n=1 Tax=Parabacteroides sp. AM08-6 TaxID=2292053 RepID=UPI000EFF939C|nr:hypothetical protein [Parabacteroides sp. AM08-6]RHJ86636.1 hypothetical protein DW103_02950 [Parabacteroides sp. AM08-6]